MNGVHSVYISGMEFTAIILAAGKGTRMRVVPRKTASQGWRSSHAGLVNRRRDRGWREADHHRTFARIRKHTDVAEWRPFAIQEQQLGTGNAVAAARDAIETEDGVAVVMFADTPLVTAESIASLARTIEDGASLGRRGVRGGRSLRLRPRCV